MGAEANLRAGAEKGAQKIFQRSFQVAHGNVRIHIQAFKLIEGGKVRGVNFVAAVGGTGSDDTHGRQLLFHGADLHGRRVRTQKLAGIKVKCILLIAGRMILRRVQRVKAVELVLNLRAVRQGKAHVAQNADGFIPHDGEGVQPARRQGAGRQRQIHPGHGGLIRLGLHFLQLGVQGFRNGLAGLVKQLADGGFFLPGNVLHARLGQGQFPFFAEDGHARVFHAAPVRRLGDACQGVPLDAYNLFLHKI